jgi:hypothetical protein
MGTNSLTYYETKFITVVKSLIIQVEREKKIHGSASTCCQFHKTFFLRQNKLERLSLGSIFSLV